MTLYFINKTGFCRDCLWVSGLDPTANPWLSLVTACFGHRFSRAAVNNLLDLMDHQWSTDYRLATAAL